MANNQWKVHDYGPKDIPLFCLWVPNEICKPIPRKYTRARVKFRITFQRVTESPQNHPWELWYKA